jgi:putative membrane protein
MKRSLVDYLGVTVRGIAMGAADVVPGVSGGTIAFITGIYEELITGLANINFSVFRILKQEGVAAAWKYINGNFFVALFVGIAISIFSLAKLVTHLLDNYPVLLWSFFFGLVIASALMIIRSIKSYNGATISALVVGVLIAGFISTIQVVTTGESMPYIFLSGALAICAMILPGISGAFILVLLGAYQPVMTAVKNLDVKIILVFMAGCVVGLLSFSKLLKYLFAHYKAIVLALLSGFLIGSLLKIWPWKENILEKVLVVHSNGKIDYMQENVLPGNYTGDSMVLWSILCMVFGFLLVTLLERVGKRNSK